jgi:hypothetical protein
MNRIISLALVSLFSGPIAFILLIAWLAGFVLAKGFWLTLLCWIPFYAWYLVVEKIMIIYNII